MYAITKEAYRRKIQAQLGLVHAQVKLKELKEKSTDPAFECRGEIIDLENKIGETGERLNELFEAEETVWEDIDDVSEHIWIALKIAVKNAVLKLEK